VKSAGTDTPSVPVRCRIGGRCDFPDWPPIAGTRPNRACNRRFPAIHATEGGNLMEEPATGPKN
jgi:hypothetical protein